MRKKSCVSCRNWPTMSGRRRDRNTPAAIAASPVADTAPATTRAAVSWGGLECHARSSSRNARDSATANVNAAAPIDLGKPRATRIATNSGMTTKASASKRCGVARHTNAESMESAPRAAVAIRPAVETGPSCQGAEVEEVSMASLYGTSPQQVSPLPRRQSRWGDVCLEGLSSVFDLDHSPRPSSRFRTKFSACQLYANNWLGLRRRS